MSSSVGECASCHQPAALKCAGCQTVFYCSKEHQRQDWPKHKELCRAYEITTSSDMGRYLVSSKDVKKDEVVISEDPIVIGPRHSGPLPDSCPGCYRAFCPFSISDICPGCKWPACSKNCSGLTNPDRHGAECQLFKIVKGVLHRCPMEIALPLRCLLLQTLKPDKWKVLKGLAKDASVKYVNGKRDQDLAKLEWKIVKDISRKVSQFIPDCSAKTVKSVFDLLEANAREVMNPCSGPLDAVYPSYCRLVHSCLPNLRVSFDLPPETGDPGNDGWKGRLTLRAIKDIAKGQPLTFGFVNLLMPTLKRQNQLHRSWNYRCSCERCLDPHELGLNTGTLRCRAGCLTGFIVPTDTSNIEESYWSCDQNCGKELTPENIVNIDEALMRQVVPCREQPSFLQEELLRSMEDHVHRNYYLCFMLRSQLAQFYGKEDGDFETLSVPQLEKKSEYCQQLLEFLANPHMPRAHAASSVATFLLEQCRTDFEVLKRNFSSKLWDKDRTVEALLMCRSLLRGVSEALADQTYTPDRDNWERRAKDDELALLAWVKVKGLTLPGSS